ncbi:MAG: ATP-binding cassette domain-containing protein [Gordonia sp. (in: high G+C Gram-positive bacteria)]|uniref:ATP-binding cassette domain-containing protein n=1 Tax=Gordonia sp. (in: high G+C Gram-positive bacteria) TaxID=84139 RepID=UPI0039E5529E
MLHDTSSTLTAVGLGFSWPDGSEILHDVDLSLEPGLSALVGDNGAGKTTLLEILAGVRAPGRGTVVADGAAVLVRQESAAPGAGTLADGLGVSPVLAALARIEHGSVDPADFEIVGDDWDPAARAVSRLDRLGLPTDLERPLTSLSGGQFRSLALARALLADPEVLLLDEPTNDLDADSRARLGRMLTEFGGAILVVSHDLALLDTAERILELRDGRLRVFGGNYTRYREVLDAERAAHAEQTAAAAASVRREQRQFADAQTALARRRRTAAKARAEKRVPPVVAGMLANKAQVSAGKLERGQRDSVAAARAELDDLRSRRRNPTAPAIRLGTPAVASGTQIITDPRLPVTGPDRVRLAGPNGSGKSRLLAALVADDAIAVPYVFVPQVVSFAHLVPESSTVAQAARTAAPGREPEDVHAHLARFGFTGDTSERVLRDLSGGERLRAGLALAVLARPEAKLLILDEPTNSLDVGTVESLLASLSAWTGALVLVSHDPGFVARAGITRTVDMIV